MQMRKAEYANMQICTVNMQTYRRRPPVLGSDRREKVGGWGGWERETDCSHTESFSLKLWWLGLQR